MTRVCALDWDNPFAERSGVIATLVAGLNRMDAAALALEGEIDARAWGDLRHGIGAFKGRTQRGEVPEACSEGWEVLHSEVDRALQGRPFQKWYGLGAAIGRYSLAAWARPFGAPLPDFRVVLDQAQRVFEDVGPGVVPVLGALVQHAPGLAVTGPRRLLRAVLGVEKHVDFPEEMERAAVCSLLGDLHMELHQQLAGLTRPDPALGANGHGDDKPVWDGDRVLTWRGVAIREFRAPAVNQIELLDAFHRENWARSIPNPFRNDQRKHAQGKVGKTVLGKTVTDLNKTLRPGTIRFRLDGTGGVNWGPRA
jgi:hypothetical protein